MGLKNYPLLLTNARRVLSIPKCIIYLAKYLNRIFHGWLIIAVACGPAAATRILICSRLLLIFIHLPLTNRRDLIYGFPPFLRGLLKFPPETKRARHYTEGPVGERARLPEKQGTAEGGC